jgi:FKBP-type peptidyl-prolyl cis-trans isomerase FklB
MRFTLIAVVGTMLLSGTATVAEAPEISEPTDRASYSLGHQIGSDLKRQGSEIDSEAMRQGLLEGLAGAEPGMDRQEMQWLLAELKRKVVADQRPENRQAPELVEDKQKLGYSVGYQVGGDFRRQGFSINPEMVIQGVLDALAGSEALMTAEEMRLSLAELQKKAVAAQQKRQEELAQENLEKGKAFLAENAEREGVIKLPSGLQYRIITEGSGRTPEATDTVTVHYRGTLIDGSEFDSSYSRGEPASFQADAVIAGWKEALQLMRQGAKWQLFVPPELGYGAAGTGPIGPNSTLIFEVELISIEEPE